MNLPAPERRAWRRPLALGLAAAAIAWGGIWAALRAIENTALPNVQVTTLSGKPTDLVALTEGKPTVVNLWATWCPPCRLEMPFLATAQQQEAGMNFVFVNQGEDALKVERYLSAVRLDLANVMLDPGARFGREIGSAALPITLFYDARGKMVDTHLGALSPALLAAKLNRLRAREDHAAAE